MKIDNRRELQNIAINHSADIDYKDYVIKIYRECTRKPFSFLTIDTTSPASDALRFRKNMFDSDKNDSTPFFFINNQKFKQSPRKSLIC